jgi:hypothetical protein
VGEVDDDCDMAMELWHMQEPQKLGVLWFADEWRHRALKSLCLDFHWDYDAREGEAAGD